jgi:hypothetical protein
VPVDDSRQVRLDVQFPVSFTGDAKGNGTVRNLSVRGCKIESDVLVHDDMLLVLRLSIPNEASTVRVDVAAVRWAIGGLFGVQFLTLHEDEQRRINRHLEMLSTPS